MFSWLAQPAMAKGKASTATASNLRIGFLECRIVADVLVDNETLVGLKHRSAVNVAVPLVNDYQLEAGSLRLRLEVA
jgi:hypothetical protein